MDRTRRLRQARDNAKQKARLQQVAEEEASQLDQFVIDAREKVEATKAARLRAAESRRILDQLQAELEEDPLASASPDEDASQAVSKSDIGALVTDSLKSVVSL